MNQLLSKRKIIILLTTILLVFFAMSTVLYYQVRAKISTKTIPENIKPQPVSSNCDSDCDKVIPYPEIVTDLNQLTPEQLVVLQKSPNYQTVQEILKNIDYPNVINQNNIEQIKEDSLNPYSTLNNVENPEGYLMNKLGYGFSVVENNNYDSVKNVSYGELVKQSVPGLIDLPFEDESYFLIEKTYKSYGKNNFPKEYLTPIDEYYIARENNDYLIDKNFKLIGSFGKRYSSQSDYSKEFNLSEKIPRYTYKDMLRPSFQFNIFPEIGVAYTSQTDGYDFFLTLKLI